MSIFKTKQPFQDLKNRDKMKGVKEDITNNESDDSSNSFQPNIVPEKFEKTEREREKLNNFSSLRYCIYFRVNAPCPTFHRPWSAK